MQQHNTMLQSQRVLPAFLSCCPGPIEQYIATHMDSVGKIINHILSVIFFMDLMMLLTSFNVAFLPGLGYVGVFLSLALLVQTVIVWLILNNDQISFCAMLRANDFKVGLAFGLTIAASTTAFCLSRAFRSPQFCTGLDTYLMPPPPSYGGGNTTSQSSSVAEDSAVAALREFEYLCESKKGYMAAAWFWSGLLFWCNFVVAMLLGMGQGELVQPVVQYEVIGGRPNGSGQGQSYDGYNQSMQQSTQFSHPNGGGPAFPGDMPSVVMGSGFVGNYATVPEIRTDGGGAPPPPQPPQHINPGMYSGYSDQPQQQQQQQPQITSV